jgi:hypothetical protein
MSQLRGLDDALLGSLRIKLAEFSAGPLWSYLCGAVMDERERILKDLTNASLPAERLKFAQGELAQANRDIILVDNLVRDINRELERRQRALERGAAR